jgi:hypothetical protein
MRIGTAAGAFLALWAAVALVLRATRPRTSLAL